MKFKVKVGDFVYYAKGVNNFFGRVKGINPELFCPIEIEPLYYSNGDIYDLEENSYLGTTHRKEENKVYDGKEKLEEILEDLSYRIRSLSKIKEKEKLND